MKILCRLLGHKYIKHAIDPFGGHLMICKRCGKNRDTYEPGEGKNPNIKYFKKEDGKKDVSE